jgi:hypothetical protein
LVSFRNRKKSEYLVSFRNRKKIEYLVTNTHFSFCF